jgi:hypothetical protein
MASTMKLGARCPPGAGSSTTSTVMVSTMGVLGRFTCLALFGTAFFAAARLD